MLKRTLNLNGNCRSPVYAAPVFAVDGTPNTVFFDADLIAESKARIHNDTATEEAQASYQRLLDEAEDAMKVGSAVGD